MAPQFILLIDAALIIGAPYALWAATPLRRHIPLAVWQIVIGLALGPSLLGRYAPDLHAFLFPEQSKAAISSLAMVAVVLFSFVTGMHLDPTAMRQSRGIAGVALGSFAAPFAIGLGLGLILTRVMPDAVGAIGDPWLFAVAIGLLVTVTALPVLGAVLKEIGLLHHRVGQQAIGLAALNDAALWIGIGVLLLASADSRSEINFIWLPLYIAAVALAARGLAMLSARHDKQPPNGRNGDGLAVAMCCFAFVSAFAAEHVGIGYVSGAFLAGLCVPPSRRAALLARLEWPTTMVLLPFFFMATGLKTTADLLSVTTLTLGLVLSIAAFLGKVIGVAVPAVIAGADRREATALGVLLQTKGMMEILAATILFNAGIVSPSVFTALLLMAIVCTTIAGPLARSLIKPAPVPAHS
ncbi:MAG: cation:proton antiporter [Alphaproteobacteria bacterium]|nr:cation:proton antiporter [Alphaproteobacteria bacterium]